MYRLRASQWCGLSRLLMLSAIALSAGYMVPYSLSGQQETNDAAEPWNIAHAAYSGKAADISKHTSNARATDFKPDGSRMYVVGRGSQNIAEYKLGKAWDIGSASFLQELKIKAYAAHGLFFNKGNGTDMYVYNRRQIQQYKLARPWNVTTAKLVKTRNLKCENAQLVRGHDIHFRADGKMFYVEDRLNQEVYQYSLGTSWDIETLKWEYTLNIADQQQAVRGIELSPDGARMWLMDTGRNEVLEYHLDTPWSLKSAHFARTLDVSRTSVNSRQITWRPDGLAFFITSTGHQKVYEFSIPIPEGPGHEER